jgi:hypothetical protein
MVTPKPIRQTPLPDHGFGADPKLVLAGLITVVTIVLALAAFIIWAVLSGASTFGAG